MLTQWDYYEISEGNTSEKIQGGCLMTRKLVVTLSASILAVAALATGLVIVLHKKK